MQNVTVRDTTLPVIAALPDITVVSAETVTRESGVYAPVTYEYPSRTDIFATVMSCTPSPGEEFEVGTTVVTCTATDENDNTASSTFEITLKAAVPGDSAPPTLTPPSAVTAEATAVRTPVDIGTATATDDTTQNPFIANNAPADYPLGTTEVTWTATDDSGNSATAVQLVTVRDTTPPAIEAPPDIRVNSDEPSTTVTFADPVVTDIFDFVAWCSPSSKNVFSAGTNVVKCTASDENSNTASVTFTVDVVYTSGVSSLELTIPPPVTAEATARRTLVDIGMATAVSTHPPASVTNDAPADYRLGSTRVTWTATDAAGNSATSVQLVTVRDTTLPEFTFTPSDIIATPSRSGSAIVTFAKPTATDATSFAVTCDPPSGTAFPTGSSKVTCEATDAAGNVKRTSFFIAVAPPIGSQYSIYIANSDEGDIPVYSGAGTYLGEIVDRRGGGLSQPWDVAFGPDGNLYVSDSRNSKILRYNGATGSPLPEGIGGLAAEWAAPASTPRGIEWEGTILYVATSMGIEMFSLGGVSLGFFGDASRTPTGTAPALMSPYDFAFCPDGRMYVSDRSLHMVFYYSDTTGSYLGSIPRHIPDAPQTRKATGMICGEAITGSGTSLYQSGDRSDGRVNEIDLSTELLVHEYTSRIDEPQGMAIDRSGRLYVADEGGSNVIRITSSTSSSVFAFLDIDDPRGVAVGPRYSAPSSSSGSAGASPEPKNSDPEFVLVGADGSQIYGPITLAPPETLTLTVRATDPEGDTISIGLERDLVPEGSVSVSDHGDGTATVTLNPSGMDAGTYVFWITAADVEDDLAREPYAVIVP